MNSPAYILKKQQALMQKYHTRKFQEFQAIENEIKQMRTYNGQIFMGGYTEPAKKSYDAQEAHIARIEKQKKEEHAKKWDGSNVSVSNFENLLQEEELAERERMYSRTGSNGLGAPRVGGAAGAHAASHGGGFNHPGVYAGGVW